MTKQRYPRTERDDTLREEDDDLWREGTLYEATWWERFNYWLEHRGQRGLLTVVCLMVFAIVLNLWLGSSHLFHDAGQWYLVFDADAGLVREHLIDSEGCLLETRDSDYGGNPPKAADEEPPAELSSFIELEDGERFEPEFRWLETDSLSEQTYFTWTGDGEIILGDGVKLADWELEVEGNDYYRWTIRDPDSRLIMALDYYSTVHSAEVEPDPSEGSFTSCITYVDCDACAANCPRIIGVTGPE